jgi:hypothetical protein
MLNIKISLVTSTGILLASKPEAVDDTRQILATGLMTALISFSKEVHHRELQSISYHDRTVSFIRVHDFVLILETIDEESTLTEHNLTQLLEKLKACTSPLLEGADPNAITEGEASIILDRCLQDIQLLNLSISEQPLKTAEISYFTIIHSDKGWEIKDKVGSGSHIPMIALMLDTLNAQERYKDQIGGLLTYLEDEKSIAYTVIESVGNVSKVGVLKFPQSMNLVLFRLHNLMNKELDTLGEDKNMEEILNGLIEVDDPGNRLSKLNLEDLSPTFLDRTISKNFEKAIFSAIVGDPIYVVGDKPTVKLVIDSLSIFTQHLQTSVNLWISEEDLTKNGKCDLHARLCGMSTSLFNKLLESGQITETDTNIKLEVSRVFGEKSSTHFKKLFDTVKRLSIAEVVTKIVHDLEKLVNLALNLTSLALFDKEKAKAKFKSLSSSGGYSANFFKKAMELAVKRNPLIDYLT